MDVARKLMTAFAAFALTASPVLAKGSEGTVARASAPVAQNEQFGGGSWLLILIAAAAVVVTVVLITDNSSSP